MGRKRERKRARRGRARAEAKGWKERREKKRRKGPFFFPPPLSASSVPLPPPVEGNRSSAVQERDEDVRASVDSGIEGGTEKERTREKGGKRSATKVAVTPCKASKLNG